jgi:voltage-gated potassium channel
MTQQGEGKRSQAYELFILVLTILSLIVMVVMLLPLSDAVIGMLQFYDNLICLIFLVDFAIRLRRARPKSAYFIGERGWLDLLGSIPSFGVAFRLSRLLRGKRRADLVHDVVHNRGKYALFITVLTTMVVLCSASVMVLQFESRSTDANITTGWNAFWFSVVTITTVGYGDYFPVTVPGRISAMFIMAAGVGVIGALASILASVLVGGSSDDSEESEPDEPELRAEIAQMRSELAVIRSLLEDRPPGA